MKIGSRTNQHELLGGLEGDGFFSGSSFRDNFPYPSNPRWWEAKHNLLECYHHLAQLERKQSLYHNIDLLHLPDDGTLRSLEQRVEKMREEWDPITAGKEKEKLRRRFEAYREYVRMLERYRIRMQQLDQLDR